MKKPVCSASLQVPERGWVNLLLSVVATESSRTLSAMKEPWFVCCPYLAILSQLIKQQRHLRYWVAMQPFSTEVHTGLNVGEGFGVWKHYLREKKKSCFRSFCIKHVRFFLWLWSHKLYITDSALHFCWFNTCICCQYQTQPIHMYANVSWMRNLRA